MLPIKRGWPLTTQWSSVSRGTILGVARAQESRPPRRRIPRAAQAGTTEPARLWTAMKRAFHPINSAKVTTVNPIESPTITETGSR
jgi:hypothetical protein